MGAVGNIWVRLGVKDDATKNVNKIFGKLKSSMLSFTAAFAGMKFLQGAIDQSNEFVEQQNALQVLLGDNEKKLEDFGKTANRTYGLGQADVLKYSNQLSGVLEITGKSKEELTDMIIGLQKHVADFGSFRQVSNIDEFIGSIVGGLSGNVSRSLKSLGIYLDQTSLQAQIAAGAFTELGVSSDQSFQSMDRGTQALIRYNSFMNQTDKANGDFARTAGTSWENTTKSLKKSLQDLQIQLGQKILPSLIKVFTWLNDHLTGVIKSLVILGAMFAGFKLGAFVGEMLKAIALLIAMGTAKVFSETGLAALVAVPAALGAMSGLIGGIIGAQGLSLSGIDSSSAAPQIKKNQTVVVNVSSITGESAINGQPFNSQGNLNGIQP